MERIADYIIRKVNDAGASHIFMISGRGILYLTDAVAKNEHIKEVCMYNEQGASYAAMAGAAASNRLSACLVSTGCASTNAVTAALCSYQDNIPVVFISGNNPLSENTRYTGIPVRTYGSQEADIISVVESVTKYAVMITDPEKVVYETEKAIYLAQNGRKGPVWIDVPLDVQNMRINEDEQEHFVYEEENSDIDINIIINELNAASRPVILIGGGCRSARGNIYKFCEKFSIPFVFSPSATDIYGAGNELSIGAVGSIGGSRAGNFAIQNSDYILAVGTKLCSQLTGSKDKFAREAKITVVDIDSAEHTKQGVCISRLIISDSDVFFRMLLESEDLSEHNSWTEKCLSWKKLFSVENEQFVIESRKSNENELYSLLNDLESRLPEDATLITDAGFEELTVPSVIRYSCNQRCLFPASQGAMGYAVPAIIGAFYAGRNHLVCIVGDGSVMMNLQELQIVSALKIPVKILIINNNMYAVIRKRQKDLFRSRTIGNDPSDGVPAPDFERIAYGFNIPYKIAHTRSEYLMCIDLLFEAEGPEIIEVLSTSEQKYLHESYALSERRKLVHRPIEDMSPFLERDVIRREMVVKLYDE